MGTLWKVMRGVGHIISGYFNIFMGYAFRYSVSKMER